MNEEIEQRLHELAQMSQALMLAWPTLESYLKTRCDAFTRDLIDHDDSELRGRIKELQGLLGLPQALQREAELLQQAPQQEGELP